MEKSIDLDFDPFAIRDAVPHDLFARARAECPVARIELGWLLSRQHDVFNATRLVDTFVASFREPGVVVPEDEKFLSEISEPRHGQIRKIINATVAHHKSMRVEPFIRDLCNEYLDPIIERGHGELMSEFVIPIPINVIAHLIGVPRADWESFRNWSDEVVQGTYPTKYANERGSGLHGAHPEFTAYVDALIAERQTTGERPDDLVSRLLDTEIDGIRLTPIEIRTQLIFLIVAGNETTRHLIANLMATVASDPLLYESLHSDRSLVERAVEESLRMDPPIFELLRNVEKETNILGPEMRPGEKIIFGIASANRDELVHADPNDFKLNRENWREHVAFGGGPHVCPGSALARLEARVALETFLDRVGSIHLQNGWQPTKTAVFWASGPVDIPVVVESR